jgi:hypothetical protein
MEFAINFSYEAAELVRAGKMRVDRFKVPDWPDLMAAAGREGRIYIHFGINVGSNDSFTRDWKLADEQARASDTRYVNVHLAAREKDFAPGDMRGPIAKMMEDIQRAANFFGRERVIVENIPLGNPAEPFAKPCGDPESICSIVRGTDTGFLLDLSHARMAARHLGRDEREYVSALPVERLAEIHLTGLGPWEGRLQDHLPMTEEDWKQTQWAFDEIAAGRWRTPGIVAFELGGVGGKFAARNDKAMMAEQVPRLYEMTHRLD